uniref:Transcription repressor n=1 Tax=Leersia perrieri TaxID=77586 RepID=A0A0D9V5A8_9ORYZ
MDGSGAGRKKLKHRLAAILSVFTRRTGGKKRRDEEGEAPPPPLAFPSYSRLGGSKKAPGAGQHERRHSMSAPRPPPLVSITIDCAGRRSVDAADPSLLAPLDLDAARKVERRLTETGLPYETGEWEGRKCPPSTPFAAGAPPPPLPPRWKEQRTSVSSSSRKLSTHSSRRLMMTTSSSSDDEYDEDSRNLFSSRSFSSDSSEFYNCPRKNARARASVSGPCRAPSSRRGASQSCRYSFELPRGSTASAATDGGFAVVKRSSDPYEDFRKSMEEMIAEGAACGDGDDDGELNAERLLETYLVLNSPRHYPAILTAFADVRQTLFP